MDKCHFCQGVVSSDNYCFGCAEFVCSDCDELMPWGAHEVEAHVMLPEEEDESWAEY